jgi:hypothetical protein
MPLVSLLVGVNIVNRVRHGVAEARSATTQRRP